MNKPAAGSLMISHMNALIGKELRSFFSSLTGYIAIIVFLLTNGLLLWVFPGNTNIMDGGFATLDSFFMLAPWVFLILIPAITMRTIAEERKTGTMELLITRPLSLLQIIMAKYTASLVVVLLSLLPALVFFYSVYHLGNPPGNIDMGGTWGSFIGLFLLASVYAAIGIFSSSLTDNQIVAFLLAAALCFFFYTGLDLVSQMHLSGSIQSIVQYLGIAEHYRSISRGVLDSRDLVYFLGIIALFMLFTFESIKNRKW